MADDSTTTISARFITREAADLAVEHLVQQHGIPRADIFVQAEDRDNTSGTTPSGGDASHDGEPRSDAALSGVIMVSADVRSQEIGTVQQAFQGAGAQDIQTT